MEALLVTILLFYLVGEPLLVTLHELGHAAVPLARGHETVVFVGGEVGPSARLGHLSVTVQPRGFLAPVTYGATATDADVGRSTVLGGALGGPVVSIVLLAGSWLAMDATVGDVARSAGEPVGEPLGGVLAGLALLSLVYLAFQTTFTLLPLHYPGWAGQYGDYRSDGMIVLDAAFGRGGADD